MPMNRAKLNFLRLTDKPSSKRHPPVLNRPEVLHTANKGICSTPPPKQTHLCPRKLVKALEKGALFPAGDQELLIAWNKSLNLSPHIQNRSICFISYCSLHYGVPFSLLQVQGFFLNVPHIQILAAGFIYQNYSFSLKLAEHLWQKSWEISETDFSMRFSVVRNTSFSWIRDDHSP